MSLIEELLKSSKTHSQSVIAGLVAIIAVGTAGGGMWINNLKTALESQDALHKQELVLATKDCKEKLARLHQLDEQVNVIDEAIKQHETSLHDTSSKLKQLTSRDRSRTSLQIEQIADELDRSSKQLEHDRSLGLRLAATTISDLTGSSHGAQQLPRSSTWRLILVLILIASIILLSWTAVHFYKRHGRADEAPK